MWGFFSLGANTICRDMGILSPCVQLFMHSPVVSTGEVDTT